MSALGGSLYLNHERADDRTAVSDAPVGGIAALDLHTIFSGGRDNDQMLVDNAFRQVQQAYYKPVDAQTLMTGEQRELVNYLKTRHVATPALPSLTATGDEDKDLASINGELSLAARKYGSVATQTALTQAAMRGMLSSLGDPYTVYLSPKEISSLEESLTGGDFGGIGVYIQQDPKSKQILVAPLDGMPAAKAGMKAGDQIVAVDGQPIASLKLDDVERLLRGKIDTVVHVVVKSHRGGAEHTLAITRQQIIVPSVKAKMEDGFDYVRLSDFGSTSYDEVRKAFLEGKQKGAKGYIFDLRDNGGGYLDAAVSISSLFIPEGAIVSTINRAGVKDVKSAPAGRSDFIGTAPLVILTNKFTASASEITAGAVQDYKVGTLLGTKTFGKGVVQSIYKTLDGGALKITTAKYLTPLGRDIQHKGIAPDILVNQDVEAPIIDTPQDVQLAAAKKFLRSTAK